MISTVYNLCVVSLCKASKIDVCCAIEFVVLESKNKTVLFKQ